MNRWAGPRAQVSEGWVLDRVTAPSRLHGANGIAAGPDGRLHIAQVPGSQVAALDVDTGAVEVISGMDGAIVAPDDLVFDDSGNAYFTEITESRVSRRDTGGKIDILRGDIPVANPITWHQGRLIVGECRVGARIMELPLDGGEPRVILADVPMANAFQVGPDGKLYFPVMGTNEIWRVALGGGAPEVVAGDLGVPDSVKFDSKGRIITTQVASGQVLRIDPISGSREMLAQLEPGLDNCAFIGERLFVSSIPGEITELLGDGRIRPVIKRGLQWPLGLAMGADGALFVADGAFSYSLSLGEPLETVCMLFTPGGPGYIRGVCAGARAGEWLVTTALGGVARWRAGSDAEWLASGLDRAVGIARSGGAAIVAEMGTGRVLGIEGGETSELATGLDAPMGVAVSPDGSVFIAEAGAGRVVRLAGGRVETLADSLGTPQGLCWADGRLLASDATGRALHAIDPASGRVDTLARGLPIGAPAGVAKTPILGPIGDMSGPMFNFAGVASGSDGTIYLAADAEGSVLSLRPVR